MRTFIAPAFMVLGALYANQAEAADPSGSRANVQVHNVRVQAPAISPIQVDRIQVSPVVAPTAPQVSPVQVSRVSISQVTVSQAAVPSVTVSPVTVGAVSGTTSRPGAAPAGGSGSFGSTRTSWDLPVSLTIAPTPRAQPKAFSVNSLDLATGEEHAPPGGAVNVTRGPAATPQLRAYDAKSIELWTTPAPRSAE